MNNVLYEISFEFDTVWLIPAAMMVFIPVFYSILRAKINASCEEKRRKDAIVLVRTLLLAAFLFVALFTAVSLGSHAYMYSKTVGAYESGEYLTVEGYVENFDPMPYGGHKRETFEINGVKFSYSDYNIHPGYNNTKSHGGVIRGDGQHLKIGYVFLNETYGNIIVYIEELPG
ncbi:MAG: hypothetical protein IJW21_06295 [Clostridia bacterium]|nr:hypothetical protein [Clostridia bacterium]